MQVKVYNQSAENTGTVNLPDGVFGLKWNADLVHQVVTSQMANMRPKVAKAKDRSEIRGGGKKPWRQKGTGRARHGSIRSPIWRGGGVTHGPITEKNYKKKINKKMAKKALYTVLSAKIRDNEIVVLEDFNIKDSKTKHASTSFKNLSKISEFNRITKGNGVLAALAEKSVSNRRALRNLPYVGVEEARNLTANQVLQYKYILFTKKVLENFK